MPKFKVLVRDIMDTPFPEVEIEGATKEEVEKIALDMALENRLGARQVRQTTFYFGIDIRDA